MKEYKKIIKDKLKNYPVLKAEIQNLKLELENIDYIGCGAIEYSEKTGATNKFNSMVENEAAYRIEKQDRLNNIIKFKENELKKIENSLRALTEEEKEIIEMRFFKGFTNTKISININLEVKYVSEKIVGILNKLKPLLIF